MVFKTVCDIRNLDWDSYKILITLNPPPLMLKYVDNRAECRSDLKCDLENISFYWGW